MGKKKSVPIPRKEFFVEVDVTFGIHPWVGLVGCEFDSAVDVFISKGFVEVPAVAEDTKGGVPAVKVPLLRVVRYMESWRMQSCRVRWVPVYAQMKSPAFANRLWYREWRV